MKTSESINEIAAALSKAQGEMSGAVKGVSNNFFKSKYSDLSAVIEAINKPFSNNGLCFIQAAENNENMIAVTTRIIHASGQWIESITLLPPVKNDAQGYGSAITYGKRYGLQALAGVPSVDDDGNAAVEHVQHSAIPTAHNVKPTAKTENWLEILSGATSLDELKTFYTSAIKEIANKSQQHLINELTNKRKAYFKEQAA